MPSRAPLIACWLGLALSGLSGPASGQDQSPGDKSPLHSADPRPVTAEHFQELLENSPFTRSLDLSDSLVLTGLANIGGRTVATLFHRESKETHVVSEAPNSQGWRLHGLEGNAEDLQQVTLRVSTRGGEVVAVRFGETQAKPGEGRPASPGGSGGASAGGPPPPSQEAAPRSRSAEIVWRMERLGESQRRDLFERMERHRRANPNLTSDQSRDWFREELRKLTN